MVNWRSRGDWDTYSANLRNAPNITQRDLDLGMTKTARKFSSSQDIMETLFHITDSYNWSEVGFGSSLWVSLVWAPCHWDIVVICAVLLLRNRPLIKFVSFAREESSWIYWADVYSHRPLVCRCTVPEDEDDDEGMNSLCRQIDAYRQESRHLDTHYEGLFLWHILPYRIYTTTWSCYHMMDLNFANLFSNCTMYVHGVVEMPIQPTWEVWVAVYRFFLQHLLLRLMWLHQFSSDCFFFDKWAHRCRGSVADFAALSRWTFHVSFSTDQLWIGGIPI